MKTTKNKANQKTTKHQSTTNKSTNKTTKNSVRIIGGQLKRRQIAFIDADGLRPTPDRLRETVFNWLMGKLHNACVLDVCAGSGVLAFESLSRGANMAVLIEYNQAQAQQLQQTIANLQLPNATVIHGDCLAVLPTLNDRFHRAFDVVFIDPPYDLQLWQAILDSLINQQLIHNDTLLYIESNKPITDILTTPLDVIKESKVGGVLAYLAKVI